MSEGFRPYSNTPPTGLAGKLKFYGRMVLDLQILTIYRDLRDVVPAFKGNVLDVGCGQSPYRFLLDGRQTKYFGIDIADAGKFDYQNPDISRFGGEAIPFDDNQFDAMICTEVLEHVQNYQKLADEIHRVMKPGATGIVTIPWSARCHYIPWDFFRYTPSSLKAMFGRFSMVRVTSRGTDICSIANKVIVIWFRNLLPGRLWRWLFVPIWIALSPVLIFIVVLAHFALWFHLGSDDDPLGYTVILKK